MSQVSEDKDKDSWTKERGDGSKLVFAVLALNLNSFLEL